MKITSVFFCFARELPGARIDVNVRSNKRNVAVGHLSLASLERGCVQGGAGCDWERHDEQDGSASPNLEVVDTVVGQVEDGRNDSLARMRAAAEMASSLKKMMNVRLNWSLIKMRLGLEGSE